MTEKPLSQRRPGWNPEFALVVIMLATLTTLVWLVLIGMEIATGSTADAVLPKDALAYRKDILSIIITAFGAWVGAGAAYFFGRENLRVAAESLLAMRESPRERLRRTVIRELPPRPVDWTVAEDADLGSVLKELKSAPLRWFVVVVGKTDGKLQTVLNEEAVWRYVSDRTEAGATYAEVAAEKVSALIAWMAARSDLARLGTGYVELGADQTAAEAHDLMEGKGVMLGIVKDSLGKPTHFITTGDLRRILMSVA